MMLKNVFSSIMLIINYTLFHVILFFAKIVSILCCWPCIILYTIIQQAVIFIYIYTNICFLSINNIFFFKLEDIGITILIRTVP